MDKIRRVFVEKVDGCDVQARQLLGGDLREQLGLVKLEGVRIVNRYDVAHVTDEAYGEALHTIFSEPQVDRVSEEEMIMGGDDEIAFAVEFFCRGNMIRRQIRRLSVFRF